MNETMPSRTIYYDTETTGVRPDKDRIVEIAAYDPDRDVSFVQFVNPNSDPNYAQIRLRFTPGPGKIYGPVRDPQRPGPAAAGGPDRRRRVGED